MSAAAVFARASRGLLAQGSIRAQDVTGRRIPALSALARYYASKSFPPHTIISMPALSPTMTAGNIGTWQKKPGDTLAPGEVLVEIETDKAQMDFEFQEEGLLAKILKDSGEKDVAVGNPIAVMIEEGGDVSAFEEFTVDDAGGEKAPPAEKKQGGQEAAEASEPPSTGSKTAPPESKDKEEAPKAQESQSTGKRLSLSIDRINSLRRAASEKGLKWEDIPRGIITEEGIKNYKPASAAPAVAGVGAAPTYEKLDVSSMRKTIASRLTQSWNENPHYFVTSRISVSKLLKLRAALNASSDGQFKLSVNDLFIKAVAIAARKVPAANSSWREEDGKVVIYQHNTVDVSVAVATPIGLMTPIVKDVTGTGLVGISSQVKDLGKRARDGKLKPEEYQGGSITISNMGMNPAVDQFTAIINPPQATIVAVGATKKVPVVKEGEDGSDVIEVDEQVAITASFDHKIVDGAVGAEFMRELKRVIENPLEMQL